MNKVEKPIPRLPCQYFLLSQQEVDSRGDFAQVPLPVRMRDPPNGIFFQGWHFLHRQFLQGRGRHFPLQQQPSGRPENAITKLRHGHMINICLTDVDLRQHFFQIFSAHQRSVRYLLLPTALFLQGYGRCTCHSERTQDGHADTAGAADLFYAASKNGCAHRQK